LLLAATERSRVKAEKGQEMPPPSALLTRFRFEQMLDGALADLRKSTQAG
jgi:hypothetical protein